MNNSQVAHNWANQVGEHGKGSNFYYQGRTIYSYGSHFPIATHTTATNGQHVIMFTVEGYSSTTSKHLCITRRAASHLTVFEVPSMGLDGEIDHKLNIEHMQMLLIANKRQAIRARSGAEFKQRLAEQAALDLNEYAQCFMLDVPIIDVETLFSEAETAKFKEQLKQESKKKREKARALLDKKREDLEKWRNGERVDTYGLNALPVALRVNGDMVETSHGAQVSIEDAISFAKFESQKGDVRGYALNGFTVKAWENAHLVIGCHKIPREEVEAMREQLLKVA